MPPPELPRNAPVLQVHQPVAVDLRPAFGHKAGVLVVVQVIQGLVCQGPNFHKPLGRQQRLHGHLAPVAVGHRVAVVLHADEEALIVQPLHHGLAGLEAIHALKVPRHFVHGAVFVHDGDHRQVVALTHRKVVGVVGGGDFHAARAKGRIDILVANDGNFRANNRQAQGFADQVLVALVLGVHRHRCIAQHSFGAGGRHF